MEKARKVLLELKKEVEKCQRCSLYKTRNKAVFGEGLIDADTIFIGEASGFYEDLRGKPFVGPAGRFLDKLFNLVRLKRAEVYITNVVKCRPVDGKRNRRPKKEEIEACKPYLYKQISIINPELIVMLGDVALKTLLPEQRFSVSEIHGKIIKKNNRIYFPTFHPAAAMRFPKIRAAMIKDFRGLREIVKNL